MVTILYFISFLTVFYTGLVPVLDNHVSDEQLMSIRNLKEWQYINHMCFEAHQAFLKGQCCVWSGEGLWEGGGEGICFFFDGFFLTYML